MKPDTKPSLKQILITIFWKQNEHHKHGVLIHTIKVTWAVIRNKNFRMFAAGILHDFGKPNKSTRDDTE